MSVVASTVNSLLSFFQVQYNRLVQIATSSNERTKGTAANPNPVESGNLGGGAVPIGNIAVYPDPNSIAYVKDGYSSNASAYIIVSLLARKFGHLQFNVLEVADEVEMKRYKRFIKTLDPKLRNAKQIKSLYQKAYKPKIERKRWKIKRSKKEYEEIVTSNDLQTLLEIPNPYYGSDCFMEYVNTYYETNGETIIWLNRGTDGQDIPLIDGPVLEMYVLPPQYMEMIPDPYNIWGSLGWVFNVAGKRIPINNENIIHWKKPNPNFDGITREHMRGMSPLRPGRKKITEDESAADASVAMNQNNGARAIVFDKNLAGPAAKMTPTKETEIRGVIDRKVNNTDMKGAVAYVQGDLGLVDLSMSSVDMNLESAKSNTLARLCNLWGISPDLFLQGSTYQNVLQARKDLMTNKVLPGGCSFAAELALKLLPAFGMNTANYTIDIDATVIPELQDDMLQLVQALSLADWLTQNEKRAEMNYESSDQEGMDDFWLSNTKTRMSDAVMADQQPDSFDPNAPDNPADNENDPVAAAKKILDNGAKDQGNSN